VIRRSAIGQLITNESRNGMSKWQNVVVGVDGSEGSRRALAWAAAAAREHQARLTVVTAWTQPPAPVGPGYGSLRGYAVADFSEPAEHQLNEAIAAVLSEDSHLVLERVLIEGHPAPRLVEASSDADLLVVGSRGHGGFAGMLLGSVSQHVAAHAHCPVVVVR
jgi:nucleotide-binding universal stress UspA family protein